jgi:hypothetical protein
VWRWLRQCYEFFIRYLTNARVREATPPIAPPALVPAMPAVENAPVATTPDLAVGQRINLTTIGGNEERDTNKLKALLVIAIDTNNTRLALETLKKCVTLIKYSKMNISPHCIQLLRVAMPKLCALFYLKMPM